MTKLLIATRNDHKVAEIRAILGVDFQCFTLRDFPGAPEVVEDAKTFAGNAGKKAQEIARWLKMQPGALPDYILTDDSGLEVDVLGGAPGVYSARFAAQDSGRTIEVELVANRGGLKMLRSDTSPHADRIARLRAEHPNLALIACGQTIERLRDSGVEVRLLPGTRVVSSALDQIVTRMSEGWNYVRI